MGAVVTTGEGGSRRSLVSWWRSRYGAKLFVEIAICGGLLLIYRGIRSFNRTDLRTAYTHAREIIQLEGWLGVPFEKDLQQWLLDHPMVIKLLNHYYIWFHFPAAIGLLLWLYLRHHDRYRGFRNLMAYVTFTALVIHLLFPLAPPRLMGGFVDTMHEFGPSIYPQNPLAGAANQIAAMPSLHFGWALIEAIAVITVLSSRWRWLIVVHPALMTLSIIATGNHWWIDAVAAGLLIVAGITVWRLAAAWIGDRSWSWTALRFQTADGIERLEAFANVAGGDQPSGEPSKVSTVANDATDSRRNRVG